MSIVSSFRKTFMRKTYKQSLINKRGLALGLLLGAFYFSVELRGQSEISAGKTGTTKPYTISVSLREEYDDNINTTSSNEEGSFKTIISPDILFRYPMDNTLLSFSYKLDAIYFNNRDGDSFDFNHNVTGRVNHKFTERFEVDFRERFSFSSEPEIGNNLATNRRSGDGFTNDLSLEGTYDWTERFSTVTSYSNTITFYDDSIVANTNEYVRHGANQDFRFKVLPTTTAVAGYGYDTFDYDVIPRDHDIHTLVVGADHYLLREWLLTGRVGAEYVLNDNPLLDDNVGPYGNLKTVWNFLPKSSLTAGYSYGTEVTDTSAFGNQVSHTFDLGVSHAWTQKFVTSMSLQYKAATFERGQALAAVNDDFFDNFYSASIKAAYAWTEWFSTEAGYTHTTSDSDLPGREYFRNQVFIGVRGTY
jgi:hypothetical protein